MSSTILTSRTPSDSRMIKEGFVNSKVPGSESINKKWCWWLADVAIFRCWWQSWRHLVGGEYDKITRFICYQHRKIYSISINLKTSSFERSAQSYFNEIMRQYDSVVFPKFIWRLWLFLTKFNYLIEKLTVVINNCDLIDCLLSKFSLRVCWIT